MNEIMYKRPYIIYAFFFFWFKYKDIYYGWMHGGIYLFERRHSKFIVAIKVSELIFTPIIFFYKNDQQGKFKMENK